MKNILIDGKLPTSIPQIDRAFVKESEEALAEYRSLDSPSNIVIHEAADRLTDAATARRARVGALMSTRSAEELAYDHGLSSESERRWCKHPVT